MSAAAADKHKWCSYIPVRHMEAEKDAVMELLYLPRVVVYFHLQQVTFSSKYKQGIEEKCRRRVDAQCNQIQIQQVF